MYGRIERWRTKRRLAQHAARMDDEMLRRVLTNRLTQLARFDALDAPAVIVARQTDMCNVTASVAIKRGLNIPEIVAEACKLAEQPLPPLPDDIFDAEPGDEILDALHPSVQYEVRS